MWNCITFKRSRPLEVLERLSLSFVIDHVDQDAVWGLMMLFKGNDQTWSGALRQVATRSAHRLMGQLWRRFVVRLRSWPWRLALVVDMSLPMLNRRQIIQECLDASPCCLDECFSQKIRVWLTEVDHFFDPPIQRWLTAIFTRALSSTAHEENQFAHFRKFANNCWRPPCLSLLAAHHIAVESTRIYARIRAHSGL